MTWTWENIEWLYLVQLITSVLFLTTMTMMWLIIRGVDHIANEVKQRLIWDKICDVEGNKTFQNLLMLVCYLKEIRNFLKEVVTELPRL
jgi:hypothetical protein